jgi:hypothetical protein
MNMNVVTGSGKVVTETRDVHGFTGVEVSGDAKVEIEQGDTERVEITADDNIMQYLQSEVSGSQLRLGPKNVSLSTKDRIVYKVFAKNISSLAASGSVSIEAKNLKTASLDVAISGSGDVNIAGEADSQKIAISGSANYKAGELASKETALAISGSGKALVAVSDKLDVQVSGSGDVEYIGTPQVTQSISGSGSVKQRKA